MKFDISEGSEVGAGNAVAVNLFQSIELARLAVSSWEAGIDRSAEFDEDVWRPNRSRPYFLHGK